MRRSKKLATKVAALVTAGKKKSSGKVRRAEDLLALIARRKMRIVEDFFDIGLALKELSRRELYGALGHRSFAELLEARKVMSATQSYKLIKVVEAFPNREQALAIGFEKAFAIVAYAAATPATDFPRVLAETGIGGKAIAALSLRDIENETKKVRARAKAKTPPTPEQRRATKAARDLQAKLRALGLRGVVVSVAGDTLEARVLIDAAVHWLSAPAKRR